MLNKLHDDPPGLYDHDDLIGGPQRGWYLAMALGTEATDEMKHPDVMVRETAIRAAAWAWYDRRRELSVKLEDEKVFVWPACLMFSNEQIADIERRLWGLSRSKEQLAGVERQLRIAVSFKEEERQVALACCFTVAVTIGLAMPFGMLVSLAVWQQPVGLADPSVIAMVLVAAGLFSFVMSVWLGRAMQENERRRS